MAGESLGPAGDSHEELFRDNGPVSRTILRRGLCRGQDSPSSRPQPKQLN